MTGDRSPGGRFQTTRWSLVLAAGLRDSEVAAPALASLCEIYWPPVYTFIRRQGHPADQARDLTQEFFTRVLEKQYFKAADPNRGRFRASNRERFSQSDIECSCEGERRAAILVRAHGGGSLRQARNNDQAGKWLPVLIAGDRAKSNAPWESVHGGHFSGVGTILKQLSSRLGSGVGIDEHVAGDVLIVFGRQESDGRGRADGLCPDGPADQHQESVR